jgi:hypothetical protein
MNQLITHSVHICSNINRIESNEKDSFSTCVQNLVPLENFALLYNRAGAEPEPPEPHQNFYPEQTEPHKNDAAP